MPSGLKRDLGLPATTAIAVGAMVGSGIFILPGLAYMQVGGPSVVMAFLVASILILPAALSASEMATAMPEDGGSYVYVERGMGPLFGTIAGVGNWFMLAFKGALALIGGAPYVIYVLPAIEGTAVPVFGDPIIPLALAVAVLFIVLNMVSTSSTGSLQFAIVGVMVVVMAVFVAGGFGDIEPAQVEGAFSIGEPGFLAATALVFISYAGVIKVAAVAEEVKDPGRVIPQAMIGSLVLTTILYVAIVYVAIGIVDIEAAIADGQLDDSGEGAIMAIAADQALGTIGVAGVTIAALMALASTANAGLLSGSRFPFAMARDGLAPPKFEAVSSRFNTPAFAVGVTGGMMLVMIAFLPIEQVAKFGSAFQIIVFILVNLALIGFREGAIEEYDPEFVAPLYPWVQIFGMAGGFLVLTQIGTVPLLGAALITGISVIYYYAYVRDRIEREGAATAGLRESVGTSAVERTRELFNAKREYDVLVAITEETSTSARRDMLRVASDLGRLRSTVVSVVEFLDVPSHVLTEEHAQVSTGSVPDWIADDPAERPDWYPDEEPQAMTSGGQEVAEPTTESSKLSEEHETAIEYRKVNSEDHRKAMADFATYEEIDLLLMERQKVGRTSRLFGKSEADWVLENAPCDVALVEDRGFEEIEEIAVANRGGGPYDPLKLLIADAIAEETGAEINLIRAIPADAVETKRESAESYHHELISTLTVPARSTVLETDDPIDGVARFVGDADLLVTGVSHRGLRDEIFGGTANQLVDAVDCTAIQVQTHDARKRGFVEQLLMEYVF